MGVLFLWLLLFMCVYVVCLCLCAFVVYMLSVLLGMFGCMPGVYILWVCMLNMCSCVYVCLCFPGAWFVCVFCVFVVVVCVYLWACILFGVCMLGCKLCEVYFVCV